MASIAPTFHGFPLSSIRMFAVLFEREQGDGHDPKHQAGKLGAGRLFLVDERSDQHGEDRRNDREEHRALTEFQASTQAEDPGKFAGEEAEQREHREAVSPAQSELFPQDVCRLLKDEKHQEQSEPCRQYHAIYPFCFPCSMRAQGSWKIIRLLRRKEGYGGNAQDQADELIWASFFLVD